MSHRIIYVTYTFNPVNVYVGPGCSLDPCGQYMLLVGLGGCLGGEQWPRRLVRRRNYQSFHIKWPSYEPGLWYLTIPEPGSDWCRRSAASQRTLGSIGITYESLHRCVMSFRLRVTFGMFTPHKWVPMSMVVYLNHCLHGDKVGFVRTAHSVRSWKHTCVSSFRRLRWIMSCIRVLLGDPSEMLPNFRGVNIDLGL